VDNSLKTKKYNKQKTPNIFPTHLCSSLISHGASIGSLPKEPTRLAKVAAGIHGATVRIRQQRQIRRQRKRDPSDDKSRPRPQPPARPRSKPQSPFPPFLLFNPSWSDLRPMLITRSASCVDETGTYLAVLGQTGADLAAPRSGVDLAKNGKCSIERNEKFKGKLIWLWVWNCGYCLRFLFGENQRFLITMGDWKLESTTTFLL